MTTRRAVAVASAVLALLVAGVGCRVAGPDRASESPAAAPTPTDADPDADADEDPPPFPPDTRVSDGGYSDENGLGLVDVRTAAHRGYDRVVFELGGSGRLGWRVEYVDEPVQEGSGDPVVLGGDEALQVAMSGIGFPDDIGIASYGDVDTRVPGTGTDGVVEIAPGGFFEGDQVAFVGLTGARRPFRAFALTDPVRLVLDVRHRP